LDETSSGLFLNARQISAVSTSLHYHHHIVIMSVYRQFLLKHVLSTAWIKRKIIEDLPNTYD